MSTSRTLLFVACVALVCTARAYADDADDAEHEDYDFYHQVEYKGHDTVDEQHVHTEIHRHANLRREGRRALCSRRDEEYETLPH